MTAAYLAATRPDLVTDVFLEDPPMFIFDPAVWPTTMYAQLFPVLQQGIRAAQATDDPVAALRELMSNAPSLRGDTTMAEALGPEATHEQALAWARFDTEAFDPALDLTVWDDHDVDTPIDRPVTVVRADPALDPAFFPEHEPRFRRLAPRARFLVAQGCTHMIHDEQPEWFAKELARFLVGLDADEWARRKM